MKKWTRWVAGITCVAAIGTSFTGCKAFMEGVKEGLEGALGGGAVTDEQAQELALAFQKTSVYSGPYAIEEEHDFTSGESNENFELRQKATYSANGDMYFYNDLTDMAEDEVPFTVFTQKTLDFYKQYVEYKNGKTTAMFSSVEKVKEKGQKGRHLLTGEEIVVYFDSLGSAMNSAFSFNLSAAADCASEQQTSYFLWNYSQMIMANELTVFGMDGLQNYLTYTREGSSFITDGEDSVYTFKYAVTADENQVAKDYKCSIRTLITVNDLNMISSISVFLVHTYEKAGVTYGIDGGFADVFYYRYEEDWIPNLSYWD